MASSSPQECDIDSEKYERLWNENRKKLERSIDPTYELIHSISLIPSLDGKLDGIKYQSITRDKVLIILNLPIGENCQTIDMFLSTLEENDHKHVAIVFRKKSSEHLMSDERHELLRKKLPRLCEYLDPESGILDELYGQGVFSLSDRERVEWEKTSNKKARKVVEILSRKPNSAFDQFIECLTKVGQVHIVHVLTGTESPPMNRPILDRLAEYRNEIIDNIESIYSTLLSKLLSQGVFTRRDKERVEGECKVCYKRNELILDILERKPQSVFDNFRKSLIETGQEHVAKWLYGFEFDALVHAESTNQTQQEMNEQQLIQAMQEDRSDDIKIAVTSTPRQSIRVKLTFFAASSIKQVKDLVSSGKLDHLLTERYCPRLVHKGLKSIRVEIADEEFERYSKEMARLALMAPKRRQALELGKTKIASKIKVNEDLLEHLSLCKYRKQAIMGSSDKVEVLMDVMARRPDFEFQELVNAFRATGQTVPLQFLTGCYSVTSLAHFVVQSDIIRVN